MSFGLPKIQISEEGDYVFVRVYISGINEGDVELHVKKDFVMVDLSRSFDKTKEDKNLFLREWESSSFNGKVSLPCKVDPIVVNRSYNGEFFEVKLKRAK